ncbi:MAG: aminomethyl-transferring glycine dehydrogenase subunit GcvPB [Spirochaetales bacterium]|nr:aminomethyl-transferring glycine dehydrogenase subunit GcvPB [Spirochaetales bacterium]
MKEYNLLLNELSRPGRKGYTLPPCDIPEESWEDMLPAGTEREGEAELPEVSEIDLIRHYTNLSNKNFGVDTGFYPLGSCTMKYNPKINEVLARLPGFSRLHPGADEEDVQGALELIHSLCASLCEITGMDGVSPAPFAGAHGELTGLMIIKAYHEHRGEKRRKIIVPDSAHGTNPASAAVCGFEVVEIPSTAEGMVDLDGLEEALDGETAGLMLTNPTTFGLFEDDVLEVAALVHEAGGLLYYDGANLNPILGHCRPGDMGFDVVHLNLHKTFSTPHGGGGPGSGPVGVKAPLERFLPVPVVVKKDGAYHFDRERPLSIGSMGRWYGNFAVLVRAYVYILMMGANGLKLAGETAVLNANYLQSRLKEYFHLPIDRVCMHEFVLNNRGFDGIHTIDIAKRLLDFGYHPPTIYFPLTIEEAIMVEPTETESKETLDGFVEVMKTIAREARTNPDMLREAPHSTPVRRLDEVNAARHPVLTWKKEN